jgi:hypothetical protein
MRRAGKFVAAVLVVGLVLVALSFQFAQQRRRQAARLLQTVAAQTIRSYQPLQTVPMPIEAQTVRILLGLRDTEPSKWTGSFRLTEGQLLEAVPWRIGAGDRVFPDGRFVLMTRQVQAGVRGEQAITENGLVLTVKAPPTASIEVTTDKGEFRFTLSELNWSKPLTFLNGQAQVDLVPLAVTVADTEREEDFPAAAVAPDGTVYVAYVEHKHFGPPTAVPIDALPKDEQGIPKDFSALKPEGGGDRIMLTWFDGKQWAQPVPVTGEGLDVWRPAVAVDGKGTVWVVWSQNLKGNWDLLVRRFDPKAKSWSKIERLTTDSGADIHVVATRTPSGQVWIAWQGWRDGNFDIFAMPLEVKGAKPLRIGSKAANEWSPSIAADSKGNIFVAFDTYEEGNYDVRLWVFNEASPDTKQIVAVTKSPLFEASASVACDLQDRVWIAWEERGPNWGKDTGAYYRDKGGNPGSTLYNGGAWVRVACWQNGQLLYPADVTENLPRRLRNFNSYPRLAVDRSGRVWLSFRHREGWRGPAGTYWQSYLTSYDGSGWTTPVPVVYSDNLLDNRPALVGLPTGHLLVVYSGDGRYRFAGPLAVVNNALYASVIRFERPSTLTLSELPPFSTPTDIKPVHPDEKEAIARLRDFRLKLGGKTYLIMRGEFHRHTEISADGGGDGSLEDMWRYALDAADLDWIGNGDHDNGGGREYLWWLTQKTTDIFHHPPKFVPMFSYERSVPYPSGHRNVMFAQRGVRTLARHPDTKGTAETGAPDTKMLYRYLRQFDGICASHTSATDMGTDWRDFDLVAEPVVELYQGCRQNYEYLGAPRSATKAEESIGGWQPAGFVWEAFKKGIKLGYQASSDHISTHISYGMVFVERPTRQDILNAFKRRHSYAATDNILLVVTCGEHLMGDEFTLKKPPIFDIYVVGTAPIARLHIIKDFKHVYTTEPKRREVKLRWQDNDIEKGKTSWYYVRVEQEDGQLAWSSPMWIRYE